METVKSSLAPPYAAGETRSFTAILTKSRSKKF